MTKEIVLNFLLMISPVVLFQLLNVKLTNLEQKSNWLSGTIFGISSLLCMTYPIHVESGFNLDLRWMPFVASILYGGFYSSILPMIMMVAYRFYLGGEAIAPIAVFVESVLLLLFYMTIKKRYHLATLSRKFVLATVSTIIAFFLMLLCLFIYSKLIDEVDFLFSILPSLVSYITLSIIALNIIILVIERLITNQRAQEELHLAEKRHLVSDLAASIAHEIRNPLTVVKGFIQLTSENIEEPYRGYMDTSYKELNRAEKIISDYLTFAKPQTRQRERISIKQELENAIGIIQSFAHFHNISIKKELESELYIVGDKLHFHQIFLNLFRNSIEATKNGSSIEVTACRTKKKVQIYIKDYGEGMTKDQVSRLGSPFYSTKEKGTGLGLMVTFRLVENMHGNIHFSSEKGKGTTTILTFPQV